MKMSLLHRLPQVALTCTAFLSWLAGCVMTQQRTRTFWASRFASSASPARPPRKHRGGKSQVKSTSTDREEVLQNVWVEIDSLKKGNIIDEFIFIRINFIGSRKRRQVLLHSEGIPSRSNLLHTITDRKGWWEAGWEMEDETGVKARVGENEQVW